MTYTNSGLVKHCKEALKLKTVYMWGGLFREVTKSYINQLSGMYPNQYGDSRKKQLCGLIGKEYYGCDCVGLVKSYYFGGFGLEKNAKGYVGAWDYGVGTMYNAAKVIHCSGQALGGNLYGNLRPGIQDGGYAHG